MTSITGLGTNTGQQSQRIVGVHQRPQHEARDPMQGVAKALGMSTTDLRSALQSGKSLNDLAGEKGVTHDDLIAAIKTGVRTDRTDDADSNQVAERIADRKATAQPAARPDAAARTVSGSTLNAVSSLLPDQDTSDLNAVSSSKQLVDYLQNRGVDLNSLRNVLSSGNLVNVTA